MRERLTSPVSGMKEVRRPPAGLCYRAGALLVLAFSAIAGAQDRSPAAAKAGADGAGPVAVVDSLKHDFETVWVNDLLEHSFTVRNVGDEPLRILKVKPACGCTLAGDHPEVILPGENGKFPFRVNTSRFHGKFSKAINIITDDPRNRKLPLTLAGEVRHYVELNPRSARFGRVKADSVLTRKVTLVNNTDQKLDLTLDQDRDTGCFSADLVELVPGQKYELTVTGRPPYKTGLNRSTLLIHTNIKKQKRLTVSCTAELPRRIDVRPGSVRVTPNSKTQNVGQIILTNNGETPVNLLSVAASDEGLTVRSKEKVAGRRYEVRVTFPAEYVPTAESAVVLQTDDAQFPELRVPIRASAPRKRKAPRPRPAMALLGKGTAKQVATTFRGEERAIGGPSDNVQVVTFYASWCGFCKRVMPLIEELHREFQRSGRYVEFVAVNLDRRAGRRGLTEQQTIEKYTEWGLTMPLVLDSGKKIAAPFKVTHFPTLFVLDRGGKVASVHVGPRPGFEQTVISQIDALLAEQAEEGQNDTGTSPAAGPDKQSPGAIE